MQTMYLATPNSPQTELAADITDTDTVIELRDSAVLPDGPNLAVIIAGEMSETIRYAAKEENKLTGVERGFQGMAQSWGAGVKVARLYTAYDHNAALDNIESLYSRLDTADTDEITLQPGLQVVSAAKDARFNLGSIKGKSEINGSGRIGIVGVENPYVIRYGANLLPPFYEWSQLGSSSRKIISPYSLSIDQKAAEGWQFVSYPLSVLPNKDYHLKCNHNMKMGVANGDGSIMVADYTESQFIQFNTGANSRITIYFSSIDIEHDVTYLISSPMLTLGTEAKPFKPREDSMLAMQTELHANPDTGADPDELFMSNGQYFKLVKWKKVVLGGSLDWTLHSNLTGYKVVKVNNGRISGFVNNAPGNKYVTKYNGNSIPWVTTSDAAEDAFWNDTNYEGGTFLIKIANTDSGWGDAYPPTADEIKAYFNGWRMCNGNNSQLYTGAAGEVKCWGPIAHPLNVIGSNGWFGYVLHDVPTYKAPVTGGYEYHPYNLLYRLAKETVEPVVSEGCLTLHEGDNVVEVGTGIVLRERAIPVLSGGSYHINNTAVAGSNLLNKSNELLSVYKSDKKSSSWVLRTNQANGYGGGNAYVDQANYDQSAAYSVTYLKLDKSPIVPITGTVAVNEKAQLSDLTAGVAEALHGVSVLTMKKAEKDAPGWITPTLLNGWVVYSGYPTLSIRKDSNNLYFDGLIKGGVYSPGTTIAHLPDGYSPRVTKVVSVPCLTGEGMYSIAHLFIRSDGTIAIFSAPGNEYLSFAGLSIPLN